MRLSRCPRKEDYEIEKKLKEAASTGGGSSKVGRGGAVTGQVIKRGLWFYSYFTDGSCSTPKPGAKTRMGSIGENFCTAEQNEEDYDDGEHRRFWKVRRETSVVRAV